MFHDKNKLKEVQDVFAQMTPMERIDADEKISAMGVKEGPETIQAFIDNYVDPRKFKAQEDEMLKKQKIRDFAMLIPQAVAGYGAAALGPGAVQAAMSPIRNMASTASAKEKAALEGTRTKVKDYLSDKKKKVKDQRDETRWQSEKQQIELEQAKKDPNSEESVNAREWFKSKLPGFPVDGMSAFELEQKFAPYMEIQKNADAKMAKKADQDAKKVDQQIKREEIEAKKSAAQATANAKVTAAKAKPSAGTKKVDETYAKEYNDWTTQGKSQTEKSLSNLREARAALEAARNETFGTTSGRIVGELPDFARTEQSRVLQQQVQESALAGIRAAMGAQFTEKEGERVLGMAYDPKMEPEQNIKKIDKIIKELTTRAGAQESKRQYFEKEGTLNGWTSSSVDLESNLNVVGTRTLPNGTTLEKMSDGSVRERK